MKHLILLLCVPIFLLSGCNSFHSHYRNSSGVQLYTEGQYAQALQTFQSNIESNPEDADAYYNIAAVHHQLGRINRDATQYTQAEQYYRIALSKNPNHASAYRGLSVWLMEQNRKEEALELLRQWTLLSPDRADPKIEYARLLQENGRNHEAIDYLAAAVALEPRNARAHRALGYLRESTNEINQAVINYRNSLQFDPSQQDLAAHLAALEAQSGTAYR